MNSGETKSNQSESFLKDITKYINIVRDVERSFAVIPSTGNNIDIIPEFFIV